MRGIVEVPVHYEPLAVYHIRLCQRVLYSCHLPLHVFPCRGVPFHDIPQHLVECRRQRLAAVGVVRLYVGRDDQRDKLAVGLYVARVLVVPLLQLAAALQPERVYEGSQLSADFCGLRNTNPFSHISFIFLFVCYFFCLLQNFTLLTIVPLPSMSKASVAVQMNDSFSPLFHPLGTSPLVMCSVR